MLDAALEAAKDICANSPAGVRLMKEVINLTEPMDLDNGYHVETYATAIWGWVPHQLGDYKMKEKWVYPINNDTPMGNLTFIV